MPDLGLLALGGLANAINSGLISYRDQRKYIDSKEEEEKNRLLKEKSIASSMVDKNQIENTDGTISKKTSLPGSGNAEAAVLRGLLEQAKTGAGKAIPENISADELSAIRQPLNTQLSGLLSIKKEQTKSDTKNQNIKTTLTPGEKKTDENYAGSYNTFVEKGANNAANAISKLEGYAKELEGDTGLLQSGGGAISSELPDFLRSRTAIRRRDDVRNSANTTLKELFGGQLSDAEREAAAKEYYNDALGNEDNAKILRRKIESLKDNYNSQSEKAKYFQSEGTLRGLLPSSLKPKEKEETTELDGVEYRKVGTGWKRVK